MNALRLVKILMGSICVFHLVAGAGLMFFVSFQKFAVASYGATLPWNDQSVYFLRIMGSFAFVLGTMAYAAARDPMRYRLVIVGFIEFFVLRNVHRHFFSNELIDGFGISSLTNNLTTVFFGAQAILLALLLWKTRNVSPLID
jgi:hypothetical protein